MQKLIRTGSPHKRGFTLIELVVVIAILGILAGIAIPRFLDAQSVARGSKVLANLRTLDAAIQQFAVRTGAEPTTLQELVPSYVAQIPAPPSSTFRITQNNGAAKDFEPSAASYDLSAEGRAVYACQEAGAHTVEWYLAAAGGEGGGGTAGGITIAETTDWSTIINDSAYQYGYQLQHGQILVDSTGTYVAINGPYIGGNLTSSKASLAEVSAAQPGSIVKLDMGSINTIEAHTEMLNGQLVWKADALPKTGDIYQVGSDYYVCLRGAGNPWDVTRDPASNPDNWKKLN